MVLNLDAPNSSPTKGLPPQTKSQGSKLPPQVQKPSPQATPTSTSSPEASHAVVVDSTASGGIGTLQKVGAVAGTALLTVGTIALVVKTRGKVNLLDDGVKVISGPINQPQILQANLAASKAARSGSGFKAFSQHADEVTALANGKALPLKQGQQYQQILANAKVKMTPEVSSAIGSGSRQELAEAIAKQKFNNPIPGVANLERRQFVNAATSQSVNRQDTAWGVGKLHQALDAILPG